MVHRIEAPLTREEVRRLRAGDPAEISGVVYTARDAAHKLMLELLREGRQLPFDIRNQIIYYVGPCPARPGQVIGSAGPTTSGRMDAYTPRLIELGLTGMIGKGDRSPEVIRAMREHGAAYFGAIGGAGALIAGRIKSEEVISFPELRAEAVRRLVVEALPVTVVIDCHGNNLYEIGKEKYRVN